jgi:hypothetical protein
MRDSSEIIYQRISADSRFINRQLELLNLVFGKNSFSSNFLRWLYHENPNGNIFGCDAYYKEKLVGHYATIPVYYFCGNKSVKGLLSLNTATHPNFQGMGIFTRLAKFTYDEAQKEGYNFVIGVSNKNSTYAFINKLDFKLVKPLDVYINFFTRSHDSNVKINFGGQRNFEFTKWRLSNPKNRYFDCRNMVVSKKYFGLLKIKISKNSRLIEIDKCNCIILLSVGINNHPKSLISLKLPEFLKPSPLNLIIRSLSTDFAIPNHNEILFENFDFDAF